MPYIISGRNLILEALNAGRPINKIFVDRNSRNGTVDGIIKKARTNGVPVVIVESHILGRLAPGPRHQGIVAYASSKGYISFESIISIPKKRNEPPLYLVLDGIEDPQNLGAILRTADAAGVHGVIVRSRRAAGLTPSVDKASSGAVEYVPVTRVANISQAVEVLKKHNIWVVGIDTTGKVDYTGVDFKLPTAIVIGSEGKGLSELVRKRCDIIVYIPMKGKISSLNAAVAAAVVIYEAVKQRDR